MSDSTSNPGLVSGHVKLAQGVVESAIGSVTGNQSWSTAGEDAKQAGVEELKSYQSQHPPSGEGSQIEAKIGSAVGCDGMVKEGEADSSATATIQSDAQAKGAVGMGGASLPGKGPGGADPAAGAEANAPTERVV